MDQGVQEGYQNSGAWHPVIVPHHLIFQVTVQPQKNVELLGVEMLEGRQN